MTKEQKHKVADGLYNSEMKYIERRPTKWNIQNKTYTIAYI